MYKIKVAAFDFKYVYVLKCLLSLFYLQLGDINHLINVLYIL